MVKIPLWGRKLSRIMDLSRSNVFGLIYLERNLAGYKVLQQKTNAIPSLHEGYEKHTELSHVKMSSINVYGIEKTFLVSDLKRNLTSVRLVLPSTK